MTYKILLPVDGSDASLHAAQHIAALKANMQALEVFIINVQPEADNWMVRRSIKPGELEKMEQEWSNDAMVPERDILQAADVTCQMRMVHGEVAPAVVRLATELCCQQIVMGVSSHGSALGDLLLGSVVSELLHLSSIPVTFIK